jgi:hypothetical protein
MAERVCVDVKPTLRGAWRSVEETDVFERKCKALCKKCRDEPKGTEYELSVGQWTVTCKCSWPGGWAECDYGCTLLVTNVTRDQRVTTGLGG